MRVCFFLFRSFFVPRFVDVGLTKKEEEGERASNKRRRRRGRRPRDAFFCVPSSSSSSSVHPLEIMESVIDFGFGFGILDTKQNDEDLVSASAVQLFLGFEEEQQSARHGEGKRKEGKKRKKRERERGFERLFFIVFSFSFCPLCPPPSSLPPPPQNLSPSLDTFSSIFLIDLVFGVLCCVWVCLIFVFSSSVLCVCVFSESLFFLWSPRRSFSYSRFRIEPSVSTKKAASRFTHASLFTALEAGCSFFGG